MARQASSRRSTCSTSRISSCSTRCEKRGAQDALRDVRKQWRRNHPQQLALADAEVPVYPTIASRFNDPGVNRLFAAITRAIGARQIGAASWGVADRAARPRSLAESRAHPRRPHPLSGRDRRGRPRAAARASRRRRRRQVVPRSVSSRLQSLQRRGTARAA